MAYETPGVLASMIQPGIFGLEMWARTELEEVDIIINGGNYGWKTTEGPPNALSLVTIVKRKASYCRSGNTIIAEMIYPSPGDTYTGVLNYLT